MNGEGGVNQTRQVTTVCPAVQSILICLDQEVHTMQGQWGYFLNSPD